MNEHTYSDALIKALETGDISYLKKFGKAMDGRITEMESQLPSKVATKTNATKETTRGQGRVYLRGSTYCISYSSR